MKELALHILDIAQNSVVAGASLVTIDVEEDAVKDVLRISIIDNGCGMTPEFLESVTDPFTTKRTTRKVGLGIPLFKLAAENTGGSFSIKSEVGKGTEVLAIFTYSHIDRQPLGDMAETILGLITAYENCDFVFNHIVSDKSFSLDTREIKQILGDVSLGSPDVYLWLSDYLKEGEEELVN